MYASRHLSGVNIDGSAAFLGGVDLIVLVDVPLMLILVPVRVPMST